MRKISGKSRGQVMVLYAGVVAVLLGAVGLCTDVGLMYFNWQQLQKAADAAVLAGANYLPGDPTTAISTAQAWPLNNSVLATEIVGTPSVTAGNTKISITLKRTVPYNFAQVLGMVSNDVQVTATAAVQGVAGAGGDHVVPVGFTCANPGTNPCASPGDKIITPGENGAPPGTYKLSPGNWGGLGFSDGQTYTGSNFADAVQNGYEGTTPILLGTASGVITTTGNDVNNFGPKGLAARYKAGSLTLPLPSPMTASDFNDPRIIEIPMVASWPQGKSQVVDITGFITAILVPDGNGTYYAQVVSISLSDQVGSSGAPNTGTLAPVLVQ
jgi:Flp pilus assembly protein TadG